MAGYKKILRNMRVFEFTLQNAFSEPETIIVVDRNDGFKEMIELHCGITAKREWRLRNIGLLLDSARRGKVITAADHAGYASHELMRLLNQTGFRGEVLFVTDENTHPLHLLRRLNNLAIDFDLDTISMATLSGKLRCPSLIAPSHPVSDQARSAVG